VNAEQVALIRTIAESPDDDAPRLVYCDWLEENGQEERAEFIRLQLRKDPPRDRIDRLILTRVQQWRDAELPRLPGFGWGDYVRGFVGDLAVYREAGLHSLALHQDEVMKVAPITRLTFLGVWPVELWPVLRPMPGLRDVAISQFWSDRAPASIEPVAVSPILSGVRTLNLRFLNLGVAELRPLADSPHLRSLRALDLTGTHIRSGDLGMLAGSDWVGGLQWLALSDRIYTGDEIREAVRDHS